MCFGASRGNSEAQPERDWEEREEREEGGRGCHTMCEPREELGERAGDGRRGRESWREELGELAGDGRRTRLEGGESGGRIGSGKFDNSKVAGGTRRETRFSQSWLGVGFFKYSRGNWRVFRKVVIATRFGPARQPLTKPRD